MNSMLNYAKAFTKGLILSLPVCIAIVDNIGSVATVQGSSMKPCFNPEYKSVDIVLLSRIGVRNFNGIKRGDVVSIVDPHDPNIILLKRIIGLQGDTIKTLRYKNKYVKIPKGHCWVEGDNHTHSMDSNTFGPIAVGLIQAKAAYIVWPIQRWSTVHSILPYDRRPLTSKECEEIDKLQSRVPNSEDIDEDSPVDANELRFSDYDSMSDCGLLPGKFGPVS